MDFHPDYANNGQIFLSFTAANPVGRSMIVRASLINSIWTFETILAIDQPANNHNGGNILFGPDGYLYIGMGDGGGGNDPYNGPMGNGQDTRTLLGAMLRLDVDSATPYAIPLGNPFAGNSICNNPDIAQNATNCPEIYAWGLRNPWRWSFDRNSSATNPVMWLGDVGQSAREEVNLIEPNKNYGWKIMEGFICRPAGPSSCDQTELTLPIHDYPLNNGNRSIVGGYVYRGTNNSDIAFLRGSYLFADTYSGRIWGLSATPSGYDTRELINSGHLIYSFAEDLQGEIYALVAFAGAGNNILHISAGNSSSSSNVATVLSKSGCVDPSDPPSPSSQTIPFDINAPLWSDNADKDRFFAIPNGTTIDIGVDGNLVFPIGSVLGKHFRIENKLIETRLLMNHQNGWGGYSYEWQYDANGDEIDAYLLADSKTITLAQQQWYFPSRTECFDCHRITNGITLGPDTRQLNRNFLYPQSGIIANQLLTLESIAVFSSALNSTLLTSKFSPIDDTTVDYLTRVKSYLHSNCSHCHRPNTGLLSSMDLRFETSFADMLICNQVPQFDLGLATPLIIDPTGTFILPNSILPLRMEASPLSSNRMPPLATSLIDEVAVRLIKNWISELTVCP